MPLARSGRSRDDHRRSPMRSLTNPNRKLQLSVFRAFDSVSFPDQNQELPGRSGSARSCFSERRRKRPESHNQRI